ncbi:hypothetical protein JCM16161A_01970 [Vulcanisaeta sp. JCM 16161]|uniref:hypothetical protein n=1 Tax=Vulcanisaeta sp. JCM 16161 TaxID=1295372 RepID=UPI00406CD11C
MVHTVGVGVGVKYLVPGDGFLVITNNVAEIHGAGDVINAVIERLNCPYGLLSDSETVVNELVDAINAGGMVIVHRLKKPAIDPLKLGLSHRDYEAHYTRPVLVWVAREGGEPIRLGKLLRGLLGYRKHACQASALIINQVLERLGNHNIIVQ